MTHIVESRFKTKKAFKKAIKEGENPYLNDPAIIGGVSGTVSEILEQKGVIYCTNHPKRSWFARIIISERTGKIVVE